MGIISARATATGRVEVSSLFSAPTFFSHSPRITIRASAANPTRMKNDLLLMLTVTHSRRNLSGLKAGTLVAGLTRIPRDGITSDDAKLDLACTWNSNV